MSSSFALFRTFKIFVNFARNNNRDWLSVNEATASHEAELLGRGHHMTRYPVIRWPRAKESHSRKKRAQCRELTNDEDREQHEDRTRDRGRNAWRRWRVALPEAPDKRFRCPWCPSEGNDVDDDQRGIVHLSVVRSSTMSTSDTSAFPFLLPPPPPGRTGSKPRRTGSLSRRTRVESNKLKRSWRQTVCPDLWVIATLGSFLDFFPLLFFFFCPFWRQRRVETRTQWRIDTRDDLRTARKSSWGRPQNSGRERPPEWDGSLNATMLSRVWVERAGSESAVFGGARPLSDLVDMPIDTVYMSMDMPCHATLCYACAFSLSPPPSLSFPLSPLSLSLSLSSPPHLFVLIRGFLVPPSCSSLLVTSLSPLFPLPT